MSGPWATEHLCFRNMPPTPTTPAVQPFAPTAAMNRLIRSLSIFTMVMTIPQVWTIWAAQQTTGVSLVSWGAYLGSAVLWFWYGLQRHDRNIYLPCVGWMMLDGAVILGVLINR